MLKGARSSIETREAKVNGKHVEWSFVPATETIHIDRTDSGGQDDEIEITGCELRPN